MISGIPSTYTILQNYPYPPEEAVEPASDATSSEEEAAVPTSGATSSEEAEDIQEPAAKRQQRQEQVVVHLNLVESENQLNNYRALPPVSVGCEAQFRAECDRFNNTMPTDGARIYLEGEPTNGAKIFGGHILIQSPYSEDHFEPFWRIVRQEVVVAIVRLGPHEQDEYVPPKGSPLSYPAYNLKISREGEENWLPFLDDCRMCYVEHNGETHQVRHYCFEQWPEKDVANFEEIFPLIQELAYVQGPILFHCTGGIGRSGTLFICLEIYKRYLQAKQENKNEALSTLDINPASLVKKLRQYRMTAVKNEKEFQMICNFVEFLNKQNSAR
jgi:protein-tyrosine phosphatase